VVLVRASFELSLYGFRSFHS